MRSLNTKKRLLLIVVLGICGTILIFFLTRENSTPKETQKMSSPFLESVDFTASFEIYTLSTKRIFTDPKYHNKSNVVYITSQEPATIYIKKPGITWADFFATLPMKLAKDCLTTGTGQVFCTNESKKLKFQINGKEDPNALDQVIKSMDKLLVTYDLSG